MSFYIGDVGSPEKRDVRGFSRSAPSLSGLFWEAAELGGGERGLSCWGSWDTDA